MCGSCWSIDSFHFIVVVGRLLQELRTLRASNNEIKAIPPEIGFCVSLETLDLSGNKLAAVAPQIGRLVALHNVYFNNNSLQSVASELGL